MRLNHPARNFHARSLTGAVTLAYGLLARVEVWCVTDKQAKNGGT